MAKQSLDRAVWENDIHIVLAAKGGIGKTYVAGLFAQYAAQQGRPMKVLDLDQSNAMLARIPSLKAESISLLSDARFDSTKFDALLKRMVSEPGPYILDVGASTFQDVWRYFLKYKVFSLLKAQGRRVIVHSVIVGGPELPDTLTSFGDVASNVPEMQVIVWINPIRGAVVMNQKTFRDMNVFENNQDKVLGIINLPEADEATLSDLHLMALKRSTLTTADSCDDLDFIAKHRLAVHRDELFDQVGSVWEAIGGKPSQVVA